MNKLEYKDYSALIDTQNNKNNSTKNDKRIYKVLLNKNM